MLREDLSIAGDVLYEKAREEIIIAMRLDWQDNKRNWFISYINALCLKTSNRLCNNKVLQIIIKKMQMYGLEDDSDTI
ncbi:MAG: hypothetical protein K2M17_03975, partial [Bacilli bacterium]|nr:hypothetical protein [Bacilli bacterium]